MDQAGLGSPKAATERRAFVVDVQTRLASRHAPGKHCLSPAADRLSPTYTAGTRTGAGILGRWKCWRSWRPGRTSMMRGVRKAVRRRGHRLLARVCGTIVRVDTLDELVALTFDDGPDPESTPQLLDLLARHGARATFFMIGERAAAHPELVSRVASQ